MEVSRILSISWGTRLSDAGEQLIEPSNKRQNIHDECPGEEATKDPVDRSDLLSTDSIRIPAKYVPRTRHARVEMELVLSSHQDELHGYNSHRKVPKERQITQKDGSYDIDPGKSPTKASSR